MRKITYDGFLDMDRTQYARQVEMDALAGRGEWGEPDAPEEITETKARQRAMLESLAVQLERDKAKAVSLATQIERDRAKAILNLNVITRQLTEVREQMGQ